MAQHRRTHQQDDTRAPGLIRAHPRRSAATLALSLCFLCLCESPVLASDFATRIINYAPAPGQNVRASAYNDPARALDAPGGNGGLLAADNSKVVTLGGFGGTITLGFDHPVWRNRFNPRACDFIIYGNAFYVSGDPLRRFAECAVVEISRDDNANGLADDAWYLIPGSHLAHPYPTSTQSWDTASLNPNWVPIGREGTAWSTTAYTLSGPPFSAGHTLINTNADTAEQVWGYADIMPTMILGDEDGDGLPEDNNPILDPARFYTRPDDPLTVGVSPHSGGGTSFRIAWAVHPVTGQPANLDRIDFVRITNAVHFLHPTLGEVSTEISGVADVRPVYSADWNVSGGITIDDLFLYFADYFGGSGEGGGADFNNSGSTTIDDLFLFINAWFAGDGPP